MLNSIRDQTATMMSHYHKKEMNCIREILTFDGNLCVYVDINKKNS